MRAYDTRTQNDQELIFILGKLFASVCHIDNPHPVPRIPTHALDMPNLIITDQMVQAHLQWLSVASSAIIF